MRDFVQKGMNRWLNQRMPAVAKIELGRKNLFVFPNMRGGLILLSTAIVLLMAINYQNNLLYGLAFLMFSLLHTAILFSYRQLSGLRIAAPTSVLMEKGGAGEIALEFSRKPEVWAEVGISRRFTQLIKSHKKAKVSLKGVSEQRGVFLIPRLYVATDLPLGLVRCWSWPQFQTEVVVYPKPEKCALPLTNDGSEKGRHVHSLDETDEFSGLRPYISGDSLSRAFWPSLAKGQALHLREQQAAKSPSIELSLESFAPLPFERRLSCLCYWVFECHSEGVPFSLKLSNKQLPLSSGQSNVDAALRALAEATP